MSLKLCPGEHLVNAPCLTCDQDALRCDLCWQDNPDDQHDDLRSLDDDEGSPWRLCAICYRKALARQAF